MAANNAKHKLQIVYDELAEKKLEGNDFHIYGFLNQILNSDTRISDEVIEYIYVSNYLECIDGANKGLLESLIDNNASVEWFRLVQFRSEEKNDDAVLF